MPGLRMRPQDCVYGEKIAAVRWKCSGSFRLSSSRPREHGTGANLCRTPMEPLSENKRLRDIFTSPSLGWIVKRLVARTTVGRPLGGALVKTGASAEERRAVDGLLGRKSTAGANLSLDLDALDRLMSAGCSLLKENNIGAPPFDGRAAGAMRPFFHSWYPMSQTYPQSMLIISDRTPCK